MAAPLIVSSARIEIMARNFMTGTSVLIVAKKRGNGHAVPTENYGVWANRAAFGDTLPGFTAVWPWLNNRGRGRACGRADKNNKARWGQGAP